MIGGYGIAGTVKRYSGTAATVTLPAGVIISEIQAFAASASTVQIMDDASVVTLPASSGWWRLKTIHPLMTVKGGANTIVFTGTASYFIETIDATGAT